MLGGKFLAQGSYGCVYGNPPLKCGKKRLSDDFVVKTMSEVEANKELAEGSVISKIDPKSEFTIYPMRKCEVTQIDEKNDNCLRDCEIWDVARRARGCKIKKKQPVHGLVMKYGGSDLNFDKFTDFDKPVFKVHTNDLLKPMLNVLNGIYKINKTHAHLDIKGMNMLYNSKSGSNQLYIIDFGLLSPREDLFTGRNEKVVERHNFPEYFAYPTDFGLLNSIRKTIDVFEMIYTEEQLFKHPRGLIPDCKLLNILEAYFRVLDGEKEVVMYSKSKRAVQIKEMYAEMYGDKKALSTIINTIFDSVWSLMYNLRLYEQDKEAEVGSIASIHVIPYFIRKELQAKKNYYDKLFNNLFGITVHSLRKLKIFKPAGKYGRVYHEFREPTDDDIITFTKCVFCYFAEVSFARGKRGIDKAFYKTFATRKDNSKPYPLNTLRSVRTILSKNIEKSRSTVDTYGLSKTLLSVVQAHSLLRQVVPESLVENGVTPFDNGVPYNKKTLDFIKILSLLSHDSLDKRLVLDENVLQVLKYVVDSKEEPVQKKNMTCVFATAMKRYRELKREASANESIITKITRVFKPATKDANAELVEGPTCGVNPSSGRCKLGLPDDGKCELITKNGKNRCKKFDKVKPVVKKAKPDQRMPKLKATTCGVNPKSGRCKLGLPEDGKCELKTDKGKRRCLKLKPQEEYPTLEEWNRRRDTIKQLPELPIGLLNRRKLTYTQAKDLFKGAVNADGHTSLAEAFNDTAKKIVDVHNEIVPEYEGRAMGKVGIAIELKDYRVKTDFKLTDFMSKVVMLMVVEDRPVSVPVPGGMLTLDLRGYKWSLSYGKQWHFDSEKKTLYEGKDYYFPQVNPKFGIDGFWPAEEYITKTKSPRNKLEERYIVKIYGVLAEEYNGKGVLDGGLTYAQVKDLYKKDGKKSFAEAYNQYVRITIAEVSEFYEGTLYEGTLNVNDYVIYENDPVENLVVKMIKLGEIDDHPITVDSPIGYINLDLDDVYDWTVEQGITLRDIKYKPRKRKMKIKRAKKN